MDQRSAGSRLSLDDQALIAELLERGYAVYPRAAILRLMTERAEDRFVFDCMKEEMKAHFESTVRRSITSEIGHNLLEGGHIRFDIDPHAETVMGRPAIATRGSLTVVTPASHMINTAAEDQVKRIAAAHDEVDGRRELDRILTLFDNKKSTRNDAKAG